MACDLPLSRDAALLPLARLLAEAGLGVVLWRGRLELGALGAPSCPLALLDGPVPALGRVRLAVGAGCATRRDALLVPCAAAEVPEAWWLDPELGAVERYLAPGGGRYRWRELLWPGERVVLAAGGGLALPPPPWPEAAGGTGRG